MHQRRNECLGVAAVGRDVSHVRVLVVDDEPPARDRLRALLRAHPDVEIVGEAGDGEEALAKIAELRPDLVFLDIELPELDGLSVAESIPPGGPQVVFATAFDQHALRAFELAAVDYLLKPIDKVRLAGALDRARKHAGPSQAADLARALIARLSPAGRKMAVRCGAKFVVFDVERVAAVLAEDHYATILVDGRDLLAEEPLDRLLTRLADPRFLRVHRSAIVNVDFIGELQHEGDRKYVAVLSDARKTRVPISRDRLQDVKDRLGVP